RARRRPVAPAGATASIRGGGVTVATTFPGGDEDWRGGGVAESEETAVAACFNGLTVEGGIASPGARAADDAAADVGDAGGVVPAFIFCAAGAALRSAVSSMASRARAVAWARTPASPRASAAIAA